MLAAIYDNDSPAGVKVRVVPKTSAQAVNYIAPKSFQKYCCDSVLHLGGNIFSLFLNIFRPIFSFIPNPHGRFSDRKMVYCQVKSVGVNPVDAKRLYGDKLPHFLLPLVELVTNGNICGIDFSGVVMNDCPGSGFKTGDEVFGTIPPFVGSLAEYVLAPADCIAHKPHNMTHAEASVVPLVGLTTLQAFDDNGIQPGMHVLVLGASGGTGHFAVQMAKIKRAKYITAVCGSHNKDFVSRLGATEVICYDDEKTKRVGGVIKALQDAVDRCGEVSIVFDAVSSHDPRDQKMSYESQICGCGQSKSSRILSTSGRYILLGGLWYDWLKAHIRRYV
jgi:NADPH:quinone reductase-like Zn-dependent oxidoreductase